MKSIALILMFFIVACNNSGSQTISCEKTTNQTRTIVSISDDKFITDAIENDFEIKNIEAICYSFKKVIKTIHNSYNNMSDTITIYFENTDTVAIYGTTDKKFILKMDINTSKIGLLENTIRIGLDKKFFIKRYPLIKSIDTFEICNTEGLICIQFTMKNGKLSNLKYRNNYID